MTSSSKVASKLEEWVALALRESRMEPEDELVKLNMLVALRRLILSKEFPQGEVPFECAPAGLQKKRRG